MKIYTVFGAEGEYSDHQEWAICSYSNEEEAKKHVEKAAEEERRAKIAIEANPALEYSHKEEDKAILINKYDPTADTYRSYTGRNHYLVVTELKEKFEEAA